MDAINDKEICQKAIDTYGKDAQTTMLFEEMAELQDAICKHQRGRATNEAVCTEIADVMIMCRQMALLYGDKKVDEQVRYKLWRLAGRLGMA